jgi:replicative DNA helicase
MVKNNSNNQSNIRGNMPKPRQNNIRIPPQSIASEQAVLGSIMLRKDAMHEVEDMITPDSFYVEKHKMIFKAMLDLSSKMSLSTCSLCLQNLVSKNF